jgi:hypothetical protein
MLKDFDLELMRRREDDMLNFRKHREVLVLLLILCLLTTGNLGAQCDPPMTTLPGNHQENPNEPNVVVNGPSEVISPGVYGYTALWGRAPYVWSVTLAPTQRGISVDQMGRVTLDDLYSCGGYTVVARDADGKIGSRDVRITNKGRWSDYWYHDSGCFPLDLPNNCDSCELNGIVFEPIGNNQYGVYLSLIETSDSVFGCCPESYCGASEMQHCAELVGGCPVSKDGDMWIPRAVSVREWRCP